MYHRVCNNIKTTGATFVRPALVIAQYLTFPSSI